MNRKATNELLIKPRMSANHRLAWLALATLVTLVLLYVTFKAGKSAGHTQIEQDQALISQLTTTTDELSKQLAEAEQNLIVAQRRHQIQQEAYDQITEAYASSERKNSYLASRLDFYRSIISPENGLAGPGIQALTAQAEGEFIQFNLTLVQAISHKTQVRGTLRVTLNQADQIVASWPETGSQDVLFQYFQEFSGHLPRVDLTEDATLDAVLTLANGERVVHQLAISEMQ